MSSATVHFPQFGQPLEDFEDALFQAKPGLNPLDLFHAGVLVSWYHGVNMPELCQNGPYLTVSPLT